MKLTALGFAVSFVIAVLIGIVLRAGGKNSTSTAGRLILLGIFGLVGVAITSAERSISLSRVLRRLQDTTAQICVRAAFLLIIGFTTLAESIGHETILGALAVRPVVAAARHRGPSHRAGGPAVRGRARERADRGAGGPRASMAP